MFWRFGAYANISTLNNLLEKPDVTLEEVLDEADLIQELKQSNSKLIEFLRDENVLRKLLEYVIAPVAPRPEEDQEDGRGSVEEKIQEKSLSPFRRRETKDVSNRRDDLEAWDREDKARAKNAYSACEILSSETWSILESLMENPQLLTTFWNFVRRDVPLDATTASYFTKINETLLDKKTEEMVRFLQSLDGIIPAMLNHIDCAAVMDLLLKIISMEKSEGGAGVVDWLQSQELMPRLLAFLNEEHAPSTQTAAGDFIKAIVTISANASQNEQSCIGPNNLTRQLVSEKCIEDLLANMLRGGYPLTVGVGMIIEVIRKNNSDYDPEVGAGPNSVPSSNDPIYLGTLLRCFARRVPDFMALLLSPTHATIEGNSQRTTKRQQLGVAFGKPIEPLGFDRFKTCELMAELLHCSNMGLLNERGSESYVKERDRERERLKAEGALTATTQPASAVTEFSEDNTSLANGVSPLALSSGSEGKRKLEVANSSAEDDGFEDVGNPTDLGDDVKDDFDEKTAFDADAETTAIPSVHKSAKPRLDLDEDFVDEPLSSPRLEAVDDEEPVTGEHESSERPEPEPNAESPTSGLTSGVDSLAVNEEQPMEVHDSPPSGITKSPEPMADMDSDFYNVGAPPLPQRERNVEQGSQEPSSPRGLSPHPDDKPAPLFAGRADHPAPGNESSNISRDDSTGTGDGSVDTTRVEEGDTNRSLLMSGIDQSFAPHFEYDVDGQPIVGDFLKMMFVEHQVVPTILDFFFRFPWNNFLHNVVYDVVQQVFNGSMDRGFNRSLAIDLFQTGRITERIVEGQARNDEAQGKNNMRQGYMGHLTLVAEEVVKFSDRHPPEVLSNVVLDKVTSPQWSDYVENTLSETRERDNAILGGVRPDMSLGPRQAVLNAVNAAHGFGGGPSMALANAGLNGNAGLDSMELANDGSATSNSNFGLSSGSLLSGFGSSSDEEDEEMEEMDDGEGGSGQDPFLPAHPTLSITPSPPTDPPPAPPPLNVPPSRARRQLAARLARHSQQKTDTESEDNANNIHQSSNLDSSSTLQHAQTDGSNDIDNYLDNDPHADPIIDDDGDDLEAITSAEHVQLSSPTNPAATPDVGKSKIQDLDLHEKDVENNVNNAAVPPSDAPPKVKSPLSALSPGHMRHLDLDDFANSPAADAEDSEDGEDVEMKVAFG